MKKISFIDNIRGFAILLVVLGHCIIKDFTINNNVLYYLRYFIYISHMPIFFFLSGYLFELNVNKYIKTNKLKYIKEKFKKLFIPYFSFMTLNIFIVFLGSQIPKIKEILITNGFVLKNIFKTIFSIFTYIDSIDNHLWFLYVMFLILIISILTIEKKGITKKIVVISLIIYLIGTYSSKYLPEIIWKTMYYLLIFNVGRYSQKQNFESKNYKCNMLLTFLIMIIVLYCKQKEFICLKFFLMIYEVIFSITILQIFKKYEFNVLNKLGNSRNTMAIYLLHMPFLLPVVTYLLMKLKMNYYICISVSFVVSVVIPYMLYKLIISRVSIIDRIFFGYYRGEKNENNVCH